jgi:hypothetical protein
MRRSMFVAVLLVEALCIARSQEYDFYISPLAYDVPYALNLFGTDVYVLQRPQLSHQSVRMMGLPPAFRGLIDDPVSDWFRNPAYDVEANSFQAYGFGNDASNILAGAIVPVDRSTFGIFASATAASDRSSGGSSSSSFSSPPPQVSSGNNATNDVSNSMGASALYRFQVEDDVALGLGYQFSRNKSDHALNYARFNSMFQNNELDDRTWTTRASTHTATLGLHLNGATTRLALRLGIARTALTLGQTYLHSSTYPSSGTKDMASHSNDVSTTGLFGGVEYTFHFDEKWKVHTLAEVAHTSYEAPGSRLFDSASGDSVFRVFINLRGNQSVSGTIFDVRIGGVAERPLGNSLTMFLGMVAGYVKNTSDQNESATRVEALGMPGIVTNENTALTLSSEGFVMQLPLGAEYAFSKVLSFRGGIMPQYLSVRKKWDRVRSDTLSSFSILINTTDKSLRFLTTMGLSLRDEEIGEIHLSYGVTESGARAWSLSARYVP